MKSKYQHIHNIKKTHHAEQFIMSKDEEKEKGLYHKYDVFKAATGRPVKDCVVLKFDDPLAQAALYLWAQEMYEAGYDKVADDTFKRLID